MLNRGMAGIWERTWSCEQAEDMPAMGIIHESVKPIQEAVKVRSCIVHAPSLYTQIAGIIKAHPDYLETYSPSSPPSWQQ